MVDLSDDGLAKTSALVSAANPKCVTRLISADVANAEDLERRSRARPRVWRSSCVLQQRGYRRARELKSVVDVNLNAVIRGTRLAVDAMRGKMGSAETSSSTPRCGQRRSAGGVFPMPQAPVLRHESRGGSVHATLASPQDARR